MRLGTVRVAGAERVAVAVDDEADAHVLLLDAGLTVSGLISDWATARPAAERAAGRAATRAGQQVPVSELEWLPPVTRPGKVICIALNNSANVDRIMSGPKHPAAFIKPASALLGHGQPIRLKKEYGRVHPEPELAVVIGTGGADIPADAALGHVFGYTIITT